MAYCTKRSAYPGIRQVPGAFPIDKGLRAGPSEIRRGVGPWLEVVSVVEDFSAQGGHRTFYQPLPRVPEVAPAVDNRADSEARPVSLAIHTGPTIPPELPGRLREIAASLDPDFRIDPVRTLDAVYESFWLQDETLASGLAGLMLGVVLFSAAGIYTLMAFTVVGRRREISIRSALGASPGRLIAGIFRRFSCRCRWVPRSGASPLCCWTTTGLLSSSTFGKAAALFRGSSPPPRRF